MKAKQFLTAAEKVLSTLILVCLLAALGVVLLGPRLWGLGFLTVYGGSMEPAIPLGALLITQQTPAEAVQAGDIIAFSEPAAPQRTVTHRVVEVTGGAGGLSFRTQGDANNAPDSDPVPAANLQGVIIAYIPLVGYAAHYARTPWGLLLLLVGILAPTLWLLALELRATRRKASGAEFRQHFQAWALLLTAAATVAGMQQLGAARGDFSDSKSAAARIAAGSWLVPTTLEAEIDAEAFLSGVPQVEPTEPPSGEPAEQPTDTPTEQPTEQPTDTPTEQPTEQPTEAPTEQPTEQPTEAPTEQPTE
ncbi:MAG TPA: signal peptidase I, partial [Anaerolineae bacterium]|nr:signal peptidase I [Anaerolineae bacterium]